MLNLDGKLLDEEYLTVTEMIFAPKEEYNSLLAWDVVKAKLVERHNSDT